jgi:hypothetical protein
MVHFDFTISEKDAELLRDCIQSALYSARKVEIDDDDTNSYLYWRERESRLMLLHDILSKSTGEKTNRKE